MKKMGDIIPRVFVDRRMNMYPLSNEIRETRNNVRNENLTGLSTKTPCLCTLSQRSSKGVPASTSLKFQI